MYLFCDLYRKERDIERERGSERERGKAEKNRLNINAIKMT